MTLCLCERPNDDENEREERTGWQELLDEEEGAERVDLEGLEERLCVRVEDLFA